MNDERHSYYTCVPLRSIEAIVPPDAAERLDLILRALIVEPEEAEDLSEDPSIIDCSTNRFAERGTMALDAALTTVGEWVSMQEIASLAAGEVADWHPKLAAWCCFPIVRELEFRNDVLAYRGFENTRVAALEMSRLTELFFLGQCEKKDLRKAIKRATRYSYRYVAMIAKVAVSNLAMSENATPREAITVKKMWSSIGWCTRLFASDGRRIIANETFRDTIAQRCMLFPR
jgi:hypothetical protein